MILANIIAFSEDDLICDMAETYGIVDYTGLPPMTCATLCVGLPETSRIKKKIGKCNIRLTDMLLALIVDGVNLLIWQRSKDGAKNRNRPESITKKLLGKDKVDKDELESFSDSESFEAWYRAKHG